jgi:hypothetical protein
MLSTMPGCVRRDAVAIIGGYVMIPSITRVAVLSFRELGTWLESAVSAFNWHPLEFYRVKTTLRKIRGPAELLVY